MVVEMLHAMLAHRAVVRAGGPTRLLGVRLAARFDRARGHSGCGWQYTWVDGGAKSVIPNGVHPQERRQQPVRDPGGRARRVRVRQHGRPEEVVA